MKNKNIVYGIIISILLIAVILLSRIFVHTPNFTPVAAVALFAGFYFRSKKWGILIAGIGMLLADSLIGFYDVRVMSAVYLSLILTVFIGSRRINLTIPKWVSFILQTGLKSLAASVIFFIFSNLAVWLFSGMYVLNAAGLVECLGMALPFFKNTFLGDMSYSFLFFGTYETIAFLNSRLIGFKKLSSLPLR